MTAKSLFAAGVAGLTFIGLTSAAIAQSGAAARGAAAAPPLRQGPPIPGLCIYSLQAVMGASKVGQSVVARLKVLEGQANAELQPQADAIQTEERTLQQQQPTLDGATFQARQANLQLRYSNLQKLGAQRNEEMQRTQQKQFAAVFKQLQPVMTSLYQQHQCSVLINADAGGVQIASPAMDLSKDAVAGLDARIQTLGAFDREHIEAQTSAAPAGVH
jgi:Skp family chaperone for outer membrane proteins